MRKLRGKAFSNDYIDVLHAARRCLPELANHKLETVSKHYGFDTTGEHRARNDCILTKKCYEYLYEEFGSEAFRKRDSVKHYGQRFTPETMALQELHSILEDYIDDGRITAEEFNELRKWIEDHRYLQGNYPFDRVFTALDQVLEDEKATEEELAELQILFSDFVDPVNNQADHNEIQSILEKHICITGDFAYGTREIVIDTIEQAGGIIDRGVKKTTDYLVVGSLGSDKWKTGNYGSKIEKALQWISKGVNITIIEEEDFIKQITHFSKD